MDDIREQLRTVADAVGHILEEHKTEDHDTLVAVGRLEIWKKNIERELNRAWDPYTGYRLETTRTDTISALNLIQEVGVLDVQPLLDVLWNRVPKELKGD